jgi:hypothetical protein
MNFQQVAESGYSQGCLLMGAQKCPDARLPRAFHLPSAGNPEE